MNQKQSIPFLNCADAMKGAPQKGGKGVVKRQITKDCICYLPSGVIQCTACGAVSCGRVRVRCAQHPNTIFISDFERCIKCSAPSCFLLSIPKK